MNQEPFTLRKHTLGQLLDATIAAHPNADAIVYVDRNVRQTWAEFGTAVDDLAKGLMALGVEPGEKIAIWATNVPHWVTTMFAAARIGAVLLTVNTSYREHELEYLLQHSQCENLFVIEGNRDHGFVQTLGAVVPELTTSQPGNVQSKTFPHLKRVIFLGEDPHQGMLGLSEVMAAGAAIPQADYLARQQAVKPTDVVNMQYTSGTTGFPKGVMLSHINIVNNGYWIGLMQRFSPADRLCIPVPLFHCFGCVLGVMAAVNHGVTMVILETFNPVQVLTAVEAERCTALYGVPTMFLSVLEHRSFPKYDVSSLRTGIMAGSVCPEPLMRRVVETLNMREVTITYGLTEASPGITMTHAHEEFHRRVGTVGRVLPGIEAKVVLPGTLEEAPRGTPGEIVCRGYNVMQGYLNMPEATAAAVTPDGWLHSGDLGTMDEEGYVVITGRIKDMIIRGGENVYPREIEEFLSSMPGVFDVQVVGVPSRVYGEEVGAFIILQPGASIGPDDVRKFCRGKIAWHKVPRHVALVEAFPMTASGKIQKYKLREMAGELFPDAMKGKR
ncbi:AMP-binding protein [Desulfovibrio cuneatus]|uniref:AMP-binding protein n=1 Tax=Desulfovibrio cuneatus TaxID=159728 RepID=UPI0004279662|nr:AMP-binding protein [Desulfovibrio cuneatus]